MAEQKQNQGTVKCAKCDRTALKYSAYEKDGRHYCCPDCFKGRTCDCQ